MAEKLVSTLTLKEGDTFRYRGSAENQRCVVIKIEGKIIYYHSGNTHCTEKQSLEAPVQVLLIIPEEAKQITSEIVE